MEFSTTVRLAVYRHFAKTGTAPSVDQIAERLGGTRDDVTHAFAQLQAGRVLLLDADGETIRMAPPFSGVPTPHTVESRGVTYTANCAWDALGIPAALHQAAVVHSSCAQSGTPLDLRVGPDGPEASAWVFHCQVPASRWWADLPFT